MVTELKTGNFKDFLQKNNLVAVDFWAEWCVDPTTKILKENNELKQAKDIGEGERLITYDGKELIGDKVKRSFTSEKLGHCKEIITETERRIKVTDEHEFFTPEGWKKAARLKVGESVAIMPLYESIGNYKSEKVIVAEDNLILNAEKGMRIKEYVSELKEKALLPLRLNNPKITILARLLGAAFSDGNLYKQKKNNYREVSFSLGTKNDVDCLREDLEDLGFDKVHLKKRRSRIRVNGREYTINTISIKVCSTSLWLLLKTLGCPVGDKTSTGYSLPNWLMRTKDTLIKREFLAAYLGGDGPKIIIGLSKREGKEPYNNLTINDIEFHKEPEVLDTGLKLAHQLSRLFKEFNVEVGGISVEEDTYLKKNGKRSKIVHIALKNNFENAFSIYKNIGYRYSYTKDRTSMYASEFIRRILYKRKEWLGNYQAAREFNKKKGYDPKMISRRLGVNYSQIWSWTKRDVKPTVKKHYMKYPRWLRESTRGLPKGLVWESVQMIKDIYLNAVQKITMEKNHNFIANGFLAHNCGPCKVMSPVFEEVGKELTKVKFAKLNVDDEPEVAGKLNVMSIPTIIVFHREREVARFSGFMSKAVFKAKLNEVIE